VTSLDPNLERIEVVAAALGPLREQLLFVGGCAAGLLISDPAATPIRATFDVDLVVQVDVLTEYHRFEEEFTKLGFKRDMTPEAPICRWVYRKIEVDLMPTQPEILGFTNRWYPLAIKTAQRMVLRSGLSIRLIDAPVFLGTKFEAFTHRGEGDLLSSHDIEDILNVVAGRSQLVGEIERSQDELRRYLAEQCGRLSSMRDFEYYLPGLIQDDSSGEQSDLVIERLRAIMDFGV
jgi:predicted nucleotidyltransferase